MIDLHRPAAGEAIDERVTYLTGDVTDLGDMTRAAETVVRDAGRLDIVIANAGVLGPGATLRASSTSLVDRLFDVNVGGALNTVRAAPPGLIKNRGRLVLVSSVFAFVNGAGAIPYAMSNAAVEQLGRGLRVELAAHGVSVTTAYFAVINTDMTRQGLDEDPVAQELLDTQPRLRRTAHNRRRQPHSALREGVRDAGTARASAQMRRGLTRRAACSAPAGRRAGRRRRRRASADVDAGGRGASRGRP
ncbi:3-phenylpropionate-dihydrodiol/cinnamic acid-dihydrodiol dehydrogenase [Streptomyces alboniger]